MNIMIKLRKIKREGNLISANVEVCQTHPEFFDITIDVVEEKIVKTTRKTTDMCVGQAIAKLVNIAKTYSPSNTPKEESSVWY